MSLRELIENKLALADIKVNGNRPWDIQVYDERCYEYVVSYGSLGMGESYMNKWLDVEQLDETVNRIFRSPLLSSYNSNWMTFFNKIASTLFNKQSKIKAYEVGKKHYDLGNDLFQCMLDSRMTYSCAYWKKAKNLDQAQEAKLDLICQKLGLKPGMKVLDIGCGWGSFLKYAAEKYKIQGLGVTISKKQLELGQWLCKGLPIELQLQDYRDVEGIFDRIVSIGQIEHVGYKNYKTFMDLVARSLEENGLFLLHTIGSNTSGKGGDPWLEKYIFPNGMLPSVSQLSQATEKKFILEDWHNFGADYDKTLMAWYKNFETNWFKIKNNYDETFYRMWKYYLLTCAGAFRSRQLQLWQIVYSKQGVPGGYVSIR